MLDTISHAESKIEIARAILVEQLDAICFARDMVGLAQRGGVSLDDLALAREELGLVARFDAPDRPGWTFSRPEAEPPRPAEKKEWHTPRLIDVIYPRKIGSTADRHNWIKAMMLDTRSLRVRSGDRYKVVRLSDRDKMILTWLALHLNIRTGRCDPSIDLLALETSMPGDEASARRVTRRSLESGEKLGWIERTGRHAGSRINRTNVYRLTIPKDILGGGLTPTD